MGSSETTFGISDTNLPIHYDFYRATTTIKGSLRRSTPIVERLSVENFLSHVKIGLKKGGFS